MEHNRLKIVALVCAVLLLLGCFGASLLTQDETRQWEHQEGGSIILSVNETENSVQFSVQDEGIGIASEDVSHIFDRFYRSDPARDRNSGGSGLGLSIARWIVERHGGYLEVLSREGLGTRFTVTLPKAQNK